MSESSKTKRNIGKIIGLLIIIILIIAGRSYYKNGFLAVNIDDPKEVNIEVPEGSSSTKIADILLDNGLIKNKYIFKIALRETEAGGKLRAGNYLLNTGMDVYDIIDELVKGAKNENVVQFTIPEGYEIRQIADKLSEEGLVNKDKFLELASDKKNFQDKYLFLKELEEGQGLEGFLFPSTYEVYKDATEEEIIDKMLSLFNKVYEENVKKNMGEYDFDLNQIVSLASIIEREAKLDEERELISAVFHNRLEQGMLLQSCATVQYALGERKEHLTDQDTRIQSDFNTYIHEGLPPAPIASPGKESLIAAVNPAHVDYLYFRTREDGTGGHTFSKTFEEHKKANPNK